MVDGEVKFYRVLRIFPLHGTEGVAMFARRKRLELMA